MGAAGAAGGALGGGGGLGQAAHGKVAEHGLLLVGPADDLGEGVEGLPLVVDQAAQGGQPGAAGEFADVPRVLAEEVEGALLGGAGEVPPVGRGGAGHSVEPPGPEAHLAGVEQGAHLEQNPVAVLQGGDHRPGVPAGEEMPPEGGERPAQVPAEEGLGRLEEVALRGVRRELRHVRLGDRLALAGVGGQLVHLLHQQARVGAHLGEQQFHRARLEARAEALRLRACHRRERVAPGLAVPAHQREVRLLLAPLREGAAAVHRARAHQHQRLRRVHRGQHLLQVLDRPERALRAAGHAVGEEVHVLEPHEPAAAEHRHGLHRLAEPVHGAGGLADVAGEAVDDLAGELVRHLGGEGVEALARHAADEEVVGAAEEGEGPGDRHPAMGWRASRGASKFAAAVAAAEGWRGAGPVEETPRRVSP